MLRNLQAEIVRASIKQTDIAEAIGVNEKTLRNKISGFTSFTFPETKAIRDMFFPDMKLKYLFAPDSPDEPDQRVG
jgi:hypothetical protein